ncbi:M23 family metallopeptidase [Nocardioides sp.]|uniref:M23 family metallopeptidase n=1 Tax=Nocardioides sp. TaxID=35761 RepID=UPI002620FBAB|nr:M23 family metallopeptidase [Nocardioides sp.]
MSPTRDDSQAPGLGTSDAGTPQDGYVGRRRAAVSAPEPRTADTAPYVGRRRAATSTLERPAPAAQQVAQEVAEVERQVAAYVGRRRAEAPAPSPAVPAAAPSADGPDTATIARVLSDLEPADASTSFAGEDTVVLPLALTREAVAGRRRAERRATRTALLRRVPSVPVLVGVAAMAVSVGGVLTTTTPDLAAAGQARIGSVGALSGSDGIGAVRPGVVSRASDRDALGDAAGLELEAQVEAQAEQRNAALDKLAKAAEQRAGVLADNQWVLPLAGYRLTATFGEYGLWANYHTGLDMAAPAGTPLVAMARAVVTSAGYDGAYGNKTVFTLEDGTELWYAHQTSIAVSVGDVVAPGDVVGTVGSTGNVTGPHLHLEVRPGGGDPVDPRAALIANGVTP